MATFDVALLQISPRGADIHANLAKGESACRQAASVGADLALFPEMWSNGYEFFRAEQDPGNIWRHPDNWNDAPPPFSEEDQLAYEIWLESAVPSDGPFVTHFRDLARELRMAIAITYLEEWPGGPRNTVSVIDREGEVAFTYAKVHTCAFSLGESACTPGDGFRVAELETKAGPVTVGAMICFDREFPESARTLTLMGAEVILTPNACELERNRLEQFRVRAYENMVGLAMANYPPPKCNGHSVAFDGMGFTADGQTRDMGLVKGRAQEGVYVAKFDLETMRGWRKRETWGAFRRPHLYGPITQPTTVADFQRVREGERGNLTVETAGATPVVAV